MGPRFYPDPIYIYINIQIGIHQTHARGGAYTASTWFSILCLFPKCGTICFSSLASGIFQSSPPSGASMIGQPSGIGTRKETVLDSAEAWIGGQKSQQQQIGVFQKDNASDYRRFHANKYFMIFLDCLAWKINQRHRSIELLIVGTRVITRVVYIIKKVSQIIVKNVNVSSFATIQCCTDMRNETSD